MLARLNPFRSERVLAVRFRAHGVSLEELVDRLLATVGRGALVGPEGSGKTTLQEDLVPFLEARGLHCHFLRLNWQNKRPVTDFWDHPLGPTDALLIDGAEVLSHWQWAKVRRHTREAGVVLVTLHRAGRLPTLHRTATSPELLRDILGELDYALDAEVARELWHRHQGNLRLALRELYDTAGERVS